jgi:hypothetical protein
MQPLARLKKQPVPSPRSKLRPPRWKSVCGRAQVFRKNCVNSSANAQQKGALASAPFEFLDTQHSLHIVAKQLAL